MQRHQDSEGNKKREKGLAGERSGEDREGVATDYREGDPLEQPLDFSGVASGPHDPPTDFLQERRGGWADHAGRLDGHGNEEEAVAEGTVFLELALLCSPRDPSGIGGRTQEGGRGKSISAGGVPDERLPGLEREYCDPVGTFPVAVLKYNGSCNLYISTPFFQTYK